MLDARSAEGDYTESTRSKSRSGAESQKDMGSRSLEPQTSQHRPPLGSIWVSSGKGVLGCGCTGRLWDWFWPLLEKVGGEGVGCTDCLWVRSGSLSGKVWGGVCVPDSSSFTCSRACLLHFLRECEIRHTRTWLHFEQGRYLRCSSMLDADPRRLAPALKSKPSEWLRQRGMRRAFICSSTTQYKCSVVSLQVVSLHLQLHHPL